MPSKTKTTRKGMSKAAKRYLADYIEYCKVNPKPIYKKQAKGSRKGCQNGKGGSENSKCNYRGVRQRKSGKWVVEIRLPKHRPNPKKKKLWLGTFDNPRDAALIYDEAAMILYELGARLNLPDSCSATTSSSISQEESPGSLDSTTTPNNSQVLAAEGITHVHPNVNNEDGGGELTTHAQPALVPETNTPGSTVQEHQDNDFKFDRSILYGNLEDFANFEHFFSSNDGETTPKGYQVLAAEVIMHVHPNVNNEDGGGELRTRAQPALVAETNTPGSTIQEHQDNNFMVDLSVLGGCDDGKTTPNNSQIFAVGDNTLVSPNVMNEDGRRELGADTQYFVAPATPVGHGDGNLKTTTTRKGKSQAAETLADWKEYSKVNPKPICKKQAKGPMKGCQKGKGGLEISKYNYRGVRQRTWGKWVSEIREPNGGKRIWLGSFDNSVDAALAYDKKAKSLYGSHARINFPDSCSVTTTSSSISPVETLAGLDSTTTSNYSDVFAVKDITSVSSNLMNEDGESIAFAYNEVARPTFAAKDITQVSPNVMNMDGKSELRADSTITSNQCEIFPAKDITHIPPNAQHEQQTGHFMVHMDERLNLDDVPEVFDDNSLSDMESQLTFDADELRFLDIDQWGKP